MSKEDEDDPEKKRAVRSSSSSYRRSPSLPKTQQPTNRESLSPFTTATQANSDERERERRGSPGCDEREIGVTRLRCRLRVASLAPPVIKNLQRLDMEYVDLIYCHRPDVQTPIEETVRAMNYVIDKGWAFYWGTGEWSAQQITEAWGVAQRLDLMGPIVE
uniref:NADP-dependent oxidoreductase domain-containing protein n=1 Tax=Fagus sylvatica TaxID=28930 RepID=A0A2N9IW52_FAGSY